MAESMPSTCTSEYWIYARNKSEPVKSPGPNCGKWMMFEPFGTVDEVWKVIKKATEEGKLGPASKVGTRKEKPGYENGPTVICIYTVDWTDEIDVMRVREALRSLGFAKKLPYKSDADTHAGVYRATGHKRISKYYC